MGFGTNIFGLAGLFPTNNDDAEFCGLFCPGVNIFAAGIAAMRGVLWLLCEDA